LTKFIAVIQARVGSKRFPHKVLKNIQKKPILHYVIKQTQASKFIDDILIATTINKQDDQIVNFCKENNYNFFRGSENDVLDRYYKCAKKNNLKQIIRITADCPLIDPQVIDLVISKFENENFDYVSNNIIKKRDKWLDSKCNFPQGMTVEISTFTALEKAWYNAKKPSEREHVFPYIQFHPELFSISNVVHQKDLSNIRCSIDRIEDLKFVEEIIKRLPEKTEFITIKDILKIIDKEPKLLETNSHILYDEGLQKSYEEDKKQGF